MGTCLRAVNSGPAGAFQVNENRLAGVVEDRITGLKKQVVIGIVSGAEYFLGLCAAFGTPTRRRRNGNGRGAMGPDIAVWNLAP